MQIDSDAHHAAANRSNGPAPLTPAEALPAIPHSPANFLFTSESVGEGHPDKIADQVSDAILDACLAQDPMSKVACETAVMTGLVLVFGEISTRAQLDYSQIVRETIRRIGYDDSSKGKMRGVIVRIRLQDL